MTSFFDKLPTVRQVIFGVLWIQIGIAIITFIASQQTFFNNKYDPNYLVDEIEVLPSEKQVRKITKKRIPGLKTSQDYLPNIELPTTLSDRLNFRIVSVDSYDRGVLVSGQIELGDTKRFVNFLREDGVGNISFIAFHSPGGNVQEAILIGQEIRDRGLDTMLSSNAFCYSACPYMMAGGVERIFSRHSLLGVHQHYYSDKLYIPIFLAVTDIQNGQADTFRHLKEMGINTDIMEYILSTPPKELFILSLSDLEFFNFATEIVY